MKKWRKLALAITFALGLVSNTGTTVQAAAKKYTQEELTQIAGYILGQSMDLILDEYVGDEVDLDMLFDAAMRGMLAELDDYSDYFTYDELKAYSQQFTTENYGIGISWIKIESGELKIVEVYEESEAAKAGLKTGDLITKINGRDAKDIATDEVRDVILSEQTVKLTLQRDGKPLSFEMKKGSFIKPTVYMYEIKDVGGAKKPDGDFSKVRYIEITSMADSTYDEFNKIYNKIKQEGVDRIILDLRYNPGGYVQQTIDICRLIVPEGVIITAVSKAGDEIVYSSQVKEAPFKKICVLTNGSTASSAEIIASALQDSGIGVVVGEKTFGKGVIQKMYDLPTEGALKLTIEEYYRRSGEKINKIGVKPDINVPVIGLLSGTVEVEIGKTATQLPKIKQALQRLGYSIDNETDVFDKKTSEAVTAFQKANALEQTGKLDEKTILGLNLALLDYYTAHDEVMDKALEEILR